MGLLFLNDVHHILQGDRLEEQLVRGIIIGGDGLRIVIDNMGLYPLLSQGHDRMNGAVVELYPLADPDRARAQDEDLLPAGGHKLALGIVGGVVIWSGGLELRSAGIHHLEGGNDLQGAAQVSYLLPASSHHRSDLLIGKARPLRPAQGIRIHNGIFVCSLSLPYLLLHPDDIYNPVDEVGPNAGDIRYLLGTRPPLQSLIDGKQSVVCGIH